MLLLLAMDQLLVNTKQLRRYRRRRNSGQPCRERRRARRVMTAFQVLRPLKWWNPPWPHTSAEVVEPVLTQISAEMVEPAPTKNSAEVVEPPPGPVPRKVGFC